jgi:hypothetical protein
MFILWVLVIWLVGACSTGDTEQSSNLSDQITSLEGSWELSEYINHPAGGTEWEDYGAEIIYQKHITPTHFTWFKYNTETDNLEGAGGGTYKFDGSVYTENIHFYHPPGSSLLGQAIPFDVKFEKDIWFHTGYSKELEFDPESSELVIVDTTKIEEQWLKLSGVTDGNNMVKTWKLTGYKSNPSDSTYAEYTDFVGYIKLLTSTHFTWIRYNGEGKEGEVIGLGSGRYESSTDSYKEFIEIMHPPGSNQVNTDITFEKSIIGNKWFHQGYVLRVEYGDNGVMHVLDSSLVDEVWQ